MDETLTKQEWQQKYHQMELYAGYIVAHLPDGRRFRKYQLEEILERTNDAESPKELRTKAVTELADVLQIILVPKL